jgi:acyl-CoA synthetase (NDP forming)
MITSLEARQLNVEDTLNEGPKLLKKYMEYAELISSNKYRPDIQYDGTEFEKNSLKNKLQEKDESLSNELPFADLVKKHGSIYDELLITDDNLFFQSLSAKEAHAYWPINFELKAWKFKKYYSREFWKNQE